MTTTTDARAAAETIFETLTEATALAFRIAPDGATAMDTMRDLLIEQWGMAPRAAANMVRAVVESIRVRYGIERAYTDGELRQILALATA